jgi:hypothetical protein
MTGLLQSWKEKLMVWWSGPDEIFYIGGAEVLPPPLTA